MAATDAISARASGQRSGWAERTSSSTWISTQTGSIYWIDSVAYPLPSKRTMRMMPFPRVLIESFGLCVM